MILNRLINAKRNGGKAAITSAAQHDKVIFFIHNKIQKLFSSHQGGKHSKWQ